jgi:molybdopterin/thiamine biosynthesis adenylyltransferase
MLKPRIKAAHRPTRSPDGLIWIGSMQYGLATELDDSTGLVWPVCERMDGTLGKDALIAAIAADRAAQPAEVEEVVDFLIESGWVEDVGAVAPNILSERELERYERSVMFQSWIDTEPRLSRYELQARLKGSKVTVLGVGGTGSAVAASLVASGVGHVHCVDFDVLELSNLNRQLLYNEADVGRLKVDAAVDRLSSMNRDVEVTGTNLLLTGAEDIVGQVRGSDAFVLCADTPHEIVYWANEAAVRLRMPFLISAYTGPMLMVGSVIPGTTGCYDCLITTQREAGSAGSPGSTR